MGKQYCIKPTVGTIQRHRWPTFYAHVCVN